MVFTTIKIEVLLFRITMSCSNTVEYHVQMNMKAARSSETLMSYYNTFFKLFPFLMTKFESMRNMLITFKSIYYQSLL